MKLNLFFKSAFDLKNVNWRYGNLQPYAVAWIDPDKKRSTEIDATNGVNPVWNEMITIPFLSTSHETAILFIDIVHAPSAANTEPQLIGSTELPIRVILDETHSKGKASFSLILERRSGRSQGSLEIQIGIKDTKIIQSEPTAQPQPQLQPRPQPQPRPRPQPQTQYQYQPQQMNQYPNLLGPVGPVYAVNSPQNIRPILVQQPVNAMLMPNMMMPQYYCPVVNPLNQMGRMLNSFERMNNNMGMVNNTGMLGNCTYVTYGNDPTATQDVYIDPTGYDDGSYITGTSDNVGYDGGAFDGSQFGTDEGLDCGVFDASGVDSGGFVDSGFDSGGFDCLM